MVSLTHKSPYLSLSPLNHFSRQPATEKVGVSLSHHLLDNLTLPCFCRNESATLMGRWKGVENINKVNVLVVHSGTVLAGERPRKWLYQYTRVIIRWCWLPEYFYNHFKGQYCFVHPGFHPTLVFHSMANPKHSLILAERTVPATYWPCWSFGNWRLCLLSMVAQVMLVWDDINHSLQSLLLGFLKIRNEARLERLKLLILWIWITFVKYWYNQPIPHIIYSQSPLLRGRHLLRFTKHTREWRWL